MIDERQEQNPEGSQRAASPRARRRLAVDEALISPRGWMTLDPLPYLKARAQEARGREAEGEAAPPAEEPILDLTFADMEAARRLRAGEAADRPSAMDGALARIPSRDVVSIGGRSLRARTPEDPFYDETEIANDNAVRCMLLLAMLIAVMAGYAFTSLWHDQRRVIEVTPPSDGSTRIVMVAPQVL